MSTVPTLDDINVTLDDIKQLIIEEWSVWFERPQSKTHNIINDTFLHIAYLEMCIKEKETPRTCLQCMVEYDVRYDNLKRCFRSPSTDLSEKKEKLKKNLSKLVKMLLYFVKNDMYF